MSPEQYAQQLQQLSDEHPWLDTNTAVALATRTDALSLAGTLKTQVATSWNGYAPVHPTGWANPGNTGAFLTRHLQAIGSAGFHPEDLAHLQEQLQATGHGRDLDPNGRWDSNWQQALHARAEQAYEQFAAGSHPGAVSSHGLLGSVLHAITPSGMLSAAWGTVKSLPSDIVQLAGDTAGNFTAMYQMGSQVLHGDLEHFGPQEFFQIKGQTSHSVQEHLGQKFLYKHLLGQEYTAPEHYGWRQDLAATLNDIGTAALFAPEIGAGIKAVKGIGTAAKAERAEGLLTRDLTHPAAQRLPTTLTSRAVMSPTARRLATTTTTGAAIGGTQAALRGEDISTGIGQGAALGLVGGAALSSARVRSGLHLSPKAYENFPVLRSLGPKMDQALTGLVGTSENPGSWYRLRTRAATPYQYGAVRLAGTAMTEGQKYSLKVNGLSWLENTTSGDPDSQPIARYVAGTHPLDPVNNYLTQHLGFTVDGHHFGVNLDDLMYVLHAPVNPLLKGPQEGTLTASISQDVHNATRAADAALGKTGLLAQFQHAAKLSSADLTRLGNGDYTRVLEFVGLKAPEAASRSLAEEIYSKLPAEAKTPLETDHLAHRQWMRETTANIRKDPELVKIATARMMHSLDEGEHYFERYVKDEISASGRSENDWARHGLTAYIDSVRLAREQILPHEAHLLHPGLVEGEWGNWGGIGKVRNISATELGQHGLQRLDGLTSQAHALNIGTMQSQAEQIMGRMVRGGHFTPDQIDALTPEQLAQTWAGNSQAVKDAHELAGRMLHYARNDLGLSEKQLLAFWDPGNPKRSLEQLLGVLRDGGDGLPSQVFLGADAPPELLAAVKRLERNGYRLVHGTDIGHHLRSDMPSFAHPEALGAAITGTRRLAETLGVGVGNFGPLDLAATSRNATVTAMLKAVEKGYLRLPRYADVGTVLNTLADDAQLAPQLPWAHNTLFAAARRFHRGNIKELADAQYGGDLHAAEMRLRQDLATVGGVRNLSREEVVKRLMNPAGHLLEGESEAWMTREQATRWFQVLKSAQADTGVHQMGLQHYLDLLRFLPFKLGVNREWDSQLATRMMSLPDTLMRTRDNLRFTLSPMFSLRRIAKGNLKMAADGVKATGNPLGKLTDSGEHEAAMAYLEKLNGDTKHSYKALDEAERFLHQNDIFGLYSSRNYEAYYAWAKKKQGFTDAQVKEGLVRVFSYGARGKEGRTALERSTNVIFFPFSFEKTVVRNIGGYLADHQAQALVLNNALSAYQQFSTEHSNNPLALSWVKEHLPLLNEALRLNAFAHGISLGEPGGVNKPLFNAFGGPALLNAFLPQQYEIKTESDEKALKRLVPLWGDLQRVVQETSDTAYVLNQSRQNAMDVIEGHQGGPFYRRPSNLAPAVQFGKALAYRGQLIEQLQQVLDYNSKVGDANAKYTFGWDPSLPSAVQGQPISKHTIGLIVQQAFPAYDPDQAALFVIRRKDDALAFINATHGTDRYDAYRDFYSKAETAVGHLNRDDYPPEQAAQAQAVFRSKAREFTATDPAFAKFYKRTFASAFGPLDLP